VRKDTTMTLEQPTYWLAYLSEAVETGPAEITATAPETLERPKFTRDARVLLAAADIYRAAHPIQRVVFAAAITRWLHMKGITWDDLDIDFYEALADLDAHAAALLIEASPIAMAVVGNAAMHLDILIPGHGIEDADHHTEPVRAAIHATLERDWPTYIRQVARHQEANRDGAV
jgi:hypothetical protein